VWLLKKTKKKLSIEVCANNLNQFYSDGDIERLEDFLEENDANIREMNCLSHCEECVCSPYALVNRKLIKAESPGKLWDKLRNPIRYGDDEKTEQ